MKDPLSKSSLVDLLNEPLLVFVYIQACLPKADFLWPERVNHGLIIHLFAILSLL